MLLSKRGQKDHETPIIQDLLKVLRRCFRLKPEGKKVIPRGDFTFDQFVQIQGVIKDPPPPIFEFLKGKTVLICEVKTPGMYLDLPVFAQMMGYQSAYLDELNRNDKLNHEVLKKTVLLTLVSKYSDSMKEMIKLNPLQEGLYCFKPFLDHYVFVIDELDFDISILELVKYTKDNSRIRKFIRWIRENLDKKRQQEEANNVTELHPHLKKEVNKMIPVYDDPKENREYISKVFQGYGLDTVVDYAFEEAKDQLLHRIIQKSGPTIIDELVQEGLSIEEIQSKLDDLKNKKKS